MMIYLISLASFCSVFFLAAFILPHLSTVFDIVPEGSPHRKDETHHFLIKLKPFLTALVQIERRIPYVWNKLAPQRKSLTRLLIMAGEPASLEASEFMLLQQISALAAPLLGITMGFYDLIFILFLLSGGYFLPRLWLREQIAYRHRVIMRELPNLIDILIMATEAGLDFMNGLKIYIGKGRQDLLWQLFNRVLQELNMGKSRRQALENMAAQVELTEMNTFVSVLNQANELGSPLGKILRVQSETLRTRRFNRAEEFAQKAPVKILAPLMICIFPTVFIILFGPLVIRFLSGEF